ncbi:MAG: TIGR00366 family protein [Blastocatellia bacterium]|nr:TIGR00366 family protein [Blastocatellia bacterium]
MKRFFGFPNTYVLIFSVLLVTAIGTWILPAGEFERSKDKEGHTIVVAGSFHPVPQNPQHVQVLMAPVEGIKQTVGIISFIFFIGGAFAVLAKTGTIDVSIYKVVQRLKHRSELLIPIVMLVFSLGGAIIGMSEETIPFVLVFIPLALALGYDSIVGVSMCFVGAGLGFAGAMLNPFTVGIAQGICELKLFSGIGYRTVCYCVIVTVGISYVMWYARRVKRNPHLSPVYEIDQLRRHEQAQTEPATEFQTMHLLVLVTFLAALTLLIFGVVKYHWYIPEMAAIFLGTGILVGVFGKLTANEIAETYIAGVKDIAGAAIVVGLSRSILVVAQDGHILDTILYYLSSLIGSGSPLIAAEMQFLVQTLLNLLVPSGSGHAALTMPLMGPLSDLVGVTRQTSVLAFQFGEGFTTLVVPTSGVTMSVLSLAKIPWKDWFKFMWPLQVILALVGAALLVWPVLTKWP